MCFPRAQFLKPTGIGLAILADTGTTLLIVANPLRLLRRPGDLQISESARG